MVTIFDNIKIQQILHLTSTSIDMQTGEGQTRSYRSRSQLQLHHDSPDLLPEHPNLIRSLGPKPRRKRATSGHDLRTITERNAHKYIWQFSSKMYSTITNSMRESESNCYQFEKYLW
jgi:hypothetical protein